MPFAVRTSPHIDKARKRAPQWCRQMGFFDSVPGVDAGALWDERRLLGFDFPHCAAMIHADASPEQLDLSSDWLAWGTYGDDFFPLVFGASRDLLAAKILDERLALFMPLDTEAPTPAPTNPIERGLDDLWRRTAGPMPPHGRRALRTAVEDMTASWLWELNNQAMNRIPDPVDYIEMRRKTFGSDMTMSLARLATADIVPPELYETRVMHEMETAAQDYAALTNDLFSYQKEIEFEGEVHNLVLVVENFLGVDRLRARDVVADLMTERMRQFEHLVEVGLPALFVEHDLDDEVRSALTRYADDLKEWMSGILEWHRRCVRYTDAELRRHHRSPETLNSLLFMPTGLGAAAVRAPLAAVKS